MQVSSVIRLVLAIMAHQKMLATTQEASHLFDRIDRALRGKSLDDMELWRIVAYLDRERDKEEE